MIKVRNPALIGLEFDMRIDDFEQYCGTVIVPHKPAPVVRIDAACPILTVMRFSLLPSSSSEPKAKFATHNARLETIDVKPTWKSVFPTRHCIVPLTDFIEPIYDGAFAGNMVAFSEKSGSVIYAAGVWDEWVSKETGEIVQSFAIITYEPPPFIAGVGHDRCPVFLDATGSKEWLINEGARADSLKEFLISSRFTPELSVATHRPMRPGWEKRK